MMCKWVNSRPKEILEYTVVPFWTWNGRNAPLPSGSVMNSTYLPRPITEGRYLWRLLAASRSSEQSSITLSCCRLCSPVKKTANLLLTAEVSFFSTSALVKFADRNIVVLGTLPFLPFASQIAGIPLMSIFHRSELHSLTEYKISFVCLWMSGPEVENVILLWTSYLWPNFLSTHDFWRTIFEDKKSKTQIIS